MKAFYALPRRGGKGNLLLPRARASENRRNQTYLNLFFKRTSCGGTTNLCRSNCLEYDAGHRGSLKPSLELRICDCSLALACRDSLCSPGNAWVQDCSELAALLGLFYPFLIASSYWESVCIAQAPDTPHSGSFLDSVVPSGFSPVTIPFLPLLLSP